MSRISLITVNYNTRECLDELLASIRNQTRQPDEVILVDNGSSDGSVEFLSQAHGWVKVVPLPTNRGFAAGANAGVNAATGDLIALVNSDVVLDERWLEKLNEALERDPTVGAVVPKVYWYGSDRVLEQAGADFNNVGHSWTRGYGERDEGQFDSASEVAALCATAPLIRRSVLGGEPLFDSDFFMYCEEFDLSLRLRGKGWKILYVPDAVCWHHGGYSANRNPQAELVQQIFCNQYRMKILGKYYPARLLFGNAPLIVASVAYWDAVFLRRLGMRTFARAVGSQFRFLIAGLRERHKARTINSNRWLSWMTSQTAGEMRQLHKSRQQGRRIKEGGPVESR